VGWVMNVFVGSGVGIWLTWKIGPVVVTWCADDDSGMLGKRLS